MSSFGLVLLAAVALGLVVTGLPAYIVLLAASTIGALAGLATGLFTIDILRALPARLFNLLESDVLQALPLYVLMGALLNRLPIGDALFRSCAALMPRSAAAPSVAGFALGALIGPMNGSVGASVLALAKTVAPKLAAAGVPPATREASIAVAATLGVVIPPSLVLILLGDALLTAHTQAINMTGRTDRVVNTQDLMRGALVPAAIFLCVCLALSWWTTRRASGSPELNTMPAINPVPTFNPVPSPSRGDVTIAVIALIFLVGLLGGVTVGLFYAVEAAAFGAFALFTAALVSGNLRGGALGDMLHDVLAATGALFAPLLAATTFTLVLRLLGTDKLVAGWVDAIPGGQGTVIAVILLAIGISAFALDAFEIIFVVVPILVPPLLVRVPDAVWVGALILLVLQTSFLLPPFGYALILARGALKQATSPLAVARALMPLLLGQIAVLALVVMVPALVHVFDPKGSTSRDVTPTAASNSDADRRVREFELPTMPFGNPSLPNFEGTKPAAPK
jgi:tripartite ATP-independent transporter DctM subunit